MTSRTRSTTTTKRGKSTRATPAAAAKRAAKAKRPVPTEAPAEETPALQPAEVEAAATTDRRRPATEARESTDERPSRYTGDYYLHATAPHAADGSVRRPGKWLIFVSRSRVDALWENVRRAVQAGRLGHAAKVSTALPNPLSPDPKKHVICVYTGDEEDAADIRRVRAALRALGITWKIPYKSDAARRAGEHEVTTGGPAAKYYE